MKGLSTPREDKQSSEHPIDAGTALIPHPLRRVGAIVSGALLFVVVGSGAALQANRTPHPEGQPKADAVVRLQTSTQTSQPAAPAPAPSVTKTDGSSDSGSTQLHTQVTSNNGDTSVTVNGQSVTPSADGTINKTVTTPDGSSVNINASQTSSDGSSASIINISSSSSSIQQEDGSD